MDRHRRNRRTSLVLIGAAITAAIVLVVCVITTWFNPLVIGFLIGAGIRGVLGPSQLSLQDHGPWFNLAIWLISVGAMVAVGWLVWSLWLLLI